MTIAPTTLLVNCSNLRIGGVLQVAHSFLEQLRESDSRWRFVVPISDELDSLVARSNFPDRFQFIPFCVKPTSWKALSGNDRFLDDLVKKHSAAAVFSPFGPTYWRPKNVPHVAGFAKSQYVMQNEQFNRILGPWKRFLLSVRERIHMRDFRLNNDCLITENPSISDLVRERIPNKPVHTVTNTFNQIFLHPNDWDRSIELPDFDGVTLLTIAANYPHKNLGILPRVADHLATKHPGLRFRFVVTVTRDAVDWGNDRDVLDRFVFLGQVPLHQCPWLYAQSDIMILPTLLECFSASYAEAMVMKVPIMTSDLPFARGLCEESAVYFDPDCPADVADRVWDVATDTELRNRIVEAGTRQLAAFDTPESRASRYLEITESRIKQHQSAISKTKKD